MKIYLVCRARAIGRADWAGRDDDPRPLSEVGRIQAAHLASALSPDPPTRIVSGPALRCMQTVEPLAAAIGLETEIDERLAIDADPIGILELLATGVEGSLVICTHARIVRYLLKTLGLVDAGAIRCRKGAYWVLEGPDDALTSAMYVDPGKVGRLDHSPRIEAETVTRAAVLDMGSNSFHLMIADVTDSGDIRPVHREKRMVRMGAELRRSGVIPEALCERSCEAAVELAAAVREHGVDRFFPVATAAVRVAGNGRAVAKRLGKALEQPVRVLSGEEEGRTVFRALQWRLGLGAAPAMGLDLGGGSLEIVVGRGAEVDAAVTTQLGVVALEQSIVESDPMTEQQEKKLREVVAAELAPHLGLLAGGLGCEAVVTGGTARALAKLLGEGVAKREPCAPLPFVSRRVLRRLCRSLVETTHEERMHIEGVRPARADLLPTGAVLLDEAAAQLDLRGYQICDWGLREGVLLDAVLPA